MPSRANTKRLTVNGGFTLVEVAAALVLLGLLLGSTLTLMNRYVDTVIDMQLRQQAFEMARSNMERLLSETTLSDMDDYGTDEFHPELDWETRVEPFYEPLTDRMWIRAVCSAGYIDTQGDRQDVELEHWITNLTKEQIRQILAQQKAEEEYLKILQGGELTDVQKTTVAFLVREGMDVEAYRKLLKKQLRQKIDYLSRNGMTGYETYLLELEEGENEFLQKLGMDFDEYNTFAAEFDPSTFSPESYGPQLETTESDSVNESGTDNPEKTAVENPLDALPSEIREALGGR
jgi:prepilin-type N-terminal cleavage/methylation domain-containing protein